MADDHAITMGNYSDLPPHERPGYAPSETPSPDGMGAAPYPMDDGATFVMPTAPSYTMNAGWSRASGQPDAQPVEYTRKMPEPDTYGPDGSYNYASIDPGALKFSAKPVPAQGAYPPADRGYDTITYSAATAATHNSIKSGKSSKKHKSVMDPITKDQSDTEPFPPVSSVRGRLETEPFPPAPSIRERSEKEAFPPMPGTFGDEIPPPPPGAALGAKTYAVREVAFDGGKTKSKEKTRESKPDQSLAPSAPRLHRLSIGREPADFRPLSPGLAPRMERLSVSGNRPNLGEIPPPSPLLEAYHGTYQSISPMPSPIMRAPRFDDDLDFEELTPLTPSASHSQPGGHSRKPSSSSALVRRVSTRNPPREASPPGAKKKKVVLYSSAAEEEARDIAAQLSRSSPDFGVLIEILPILSHDQMLELRTAYKKVCKIQGKGINIAKHIKMKVPGSLGKIAYVTALGRWESEGYWANSWYQSNNARRELLIESLTGRTNAEIRSIKGAFRDKRYGDSLSRCMDKELKADKFRTAILLALEERRQEESESWGIEERNRDVDALHRALREGRETAMLNIVVLRSDAHLREVLRTYERMHRRNFAKEALKRSNNLVGEVIAHILNGVINKPARDAMLLHHALEDLSGENSTGRESSRHVPKDRYELLVSRLVRLHWDRSHLRRVKDEYRELYRKSLERDIDGRTRGDFRDFCIALCEGGR